MTTQLPNIYGFNKTSEAGPDVLAYSLFLGGCNFKCPYCMNSKLISGSPNLPTVSIESVKSSILENKPQWVILSGGEVLVNDINSVANLILLLKDMNCKVGLSTNGSFPIKLLMIMCLLDYVALDIKGDRSVYIREYFPNEDHDVFEGVLLSKSTLEFHHNTREDFNYEIRTTLFPPFVCGDKFDNICAIIKSDEKWVLQQYRAAKTMLDQKCKDITPFNDEEVKDYLKKAKACTVYASIRYV